MVENNCHATSSCKLVFACSGAADVGALTDQAARAMTRSGTAKMFCTAGIGGRVEPILETTQAATTILAIDGCPMDCTKRSLALAGIRNFGHLRLTTLGMVKGQTEVSDANIARVVDEAEKLLN